jgi:hypothetical protein
MTNEENPHVEQAIVTTVIRGKGTDDDVLRRVVQVFTLSGELIAEHDPACPGNHTMPADDSQPRIDMGFGPASPPLSVLIVKIREIALGLTPTNRVRMFGLVMRGFCHFCGSDKLPCHCENDE